MIHFSANIFFEKDDIQISEEPHVVKNCKKCIVNR